ncbi:DUF6415 family natural product biosynthesis protein [Streptomyces sp. NPDC001156]
MRHRTAAPPSAVDQAPPDLATMREAVDRLLDPDAVPVALPPAPDELEALTLQLRGHLDLLMPTVEELAARLGKNSIPRYCALACVGEARLRLKEEPSSAIGGALAHARRLARVLNALCDHFEALARAAP